MPGMLKTRLGEDRAAEQDADVEAGSVTTGVIAPRSPCRTTTRRSVQALGARRADVVLAHHLDQVRAQQPRVEGGERRRPARTTAGAASVNHCAGVLARAARSCRRRGRSGTCRCRSRRGTARRGRASRRAPRSRRSAPPIVARSSSERRRTAEMMPIGDRRPASQMTSAPTVSEIVAGRRSKICVLHRRRCSGSE